MGVANGLLNIAGGAGNLVLNPFKYGAKVLGEVADTGSELVKDAREHQGGKALDDLRHLGARGLQIPVDFAVSEWNSIKCAAGGFGEVLRSGGNFIGEPVRNLVGQGK